MIWESKKNQSKKMIVMLLRKTEFVKCCSQELNSLKMSFKEIKEEVIKVVLYFNYSPSQIPELKKNQSKKMIKTLLRRTKLFKWCLGERRRNCNSKRFNKKS